LRRDRRTPLRSVAAAVTAPANFSREYLHHLFAADEMLGPTLLSIHNLSFYLRLMADARQADRRGPLRGAENRSACRWCRIS